jgi:putative FmdB family regulatory protein
MPIYAYRCDACGHAKDVLQKISDPMLSVCPACGASAFRKQVTAAGFQLKGSGWYVTDFRDKKSSDNGAPKTEGGDPAKGDAAQGEAAKPAESKPDAAAPAPAASSGDSKPAASPSPAAPAADGKSTTPS